MIGANPKTRQRRTLQSGFSVLARGEPQIWFTGGMLIVCLAMIIGLIGLIVVSGLPTFWPKPLDVLALNDGSLEIGQLQKKQVRSDRSQHAESAKASAKQGEPSFYFRTENAQMTDRPFRWIDPHELNLSGILRPSWGMVVERTAWGRLYAIPLSLSEEFQPDAAAIDTQLAVDETLQTLTAMSGYLDASLVERLTGILENYRQQQRNASLRAALANQEAAMQSTGVLQFQTDEGNWTPVAQLTLQDSVQQLRMLSVEPDQLNSRLQAAVARCTELRHQAEDMRIEISRRDARIAGLRASVRRAELKAKIKLAQRVEDSNFLLEQQVELGTREAAIQRALDIIQLACADDNESNSAALAAFAAYRNQQLPTQIATVDSQLSEWMAPISTQPQSIVAAVREYQSQYRAIVEEKLPLVQQLQKLEAELQVGEVNFAVPTGGTPLKDLSAEDISSLVDGQLSPALRTQLSENSIDARSVKIGDRNEQLILLEVMDRQFQPHRLAVVQPGYTEQSAAGEQQVLLLPEKSLPCQEVVRAIPVNQLDLSGKLAVYGDRWREFLTENPRQNIEGGVFPAIWGTVVMTLIMTIAVVPFGVMAALYLREYTQAGPLVSLIRISINNLAGVPSIVYGVFGFSFFCYLIGAYIDGGPRNADITPWPSAWWFIVLGVTAVIGTAAFLLSFLASGPAHEQTAKTRWMSKIALGCWLLSVVAICGLLLKSPFFDGFYPEHLPNPTFGKGGLLWAALTLSLLTLPVVIVATEEALAAVPNSLREGSLACGASKWQTIRRIILPHARPGILTGAILAMARGAGEVAPLMLVGALPSAPDLPLDSEFPYFHGSRSFMHLGYQIYTLGFQSPNSEAAKPMVFTCTLLLIVIIAALNISAIYLRARLRRRFQGNQF